MPDPSSQFYPTYWKWELLAMEGQSELYRFFTYVGEDCCQLASYGMVPLEGIVKLSSITRPSLLPTTLAREAREYLEAGRRSPSTSKRYTTILSEVRQEMRGLLK